MCVLKGMLHNVAAPAARKAFKIMHAAVFFSSIVFRFPDIYFFLFIYIFVGFCLASAPNKFKLARRVYLDLK